jgi:hypothetical protein
VVCARYGCTHPAGYHVVTGSSPYVTDDAALVHLGMGGALCDEADEVTHASSTSTVSNASFTQLALPGRRSTVCQRTCLLDG